MEDMNENSKRKRRKTFWCFFFDRSKMKILTAILFLLGPVIGTVSGSELQAPRFITQPSASGSIVAEGRTKILQCQALGFPQVEYRWMKDGVFLSDFSSEHFYKIQSVSRSDAGDYRCYAKNSVGTIISEKIKLTVAYMSPFENDPPQVLRVKAGHAAVFHLPLIASVPEPSVTWQREDNHKPLYGTKYAVTDEQSQIILSVDSQEMARYRARATNTQIGQEENSGYTFLEVYGEDGADVPPEIVVPPRDKTVVRGTTLSELHCIANARPLHALEILWFKDGRPIDEVGVPFSFNDLWNRTLSLFEADFKHQGVYTCQARMTTGGPTLSKDATIVITEKPHFKTHMKVSTAGEFGKAITVPCDVHSVPSPNVTWFRNGIPLSETPNLRFEVIRKEADDENGQGHPLHSLHINFLRQEDSGMFECMAENEAGDIVGYTWLRVKTSSPVMINPPQNQTALDGKDATIACEAEAAPAPNVTWYFNDGEISFSGRLQILEDGSLLISKVRSTDEGKYTCERSNEAGSVREDAWISVLVRTQIIQPPVDTKVILGHVASLQCRASSDPNVPYEIRWYHEGRLINAAASFRINTDDASGTLEIGEARASDAGEYTCEVSSAGGNDRRSASLDVIELPYAPAKVHAEKVSTAHKTVNVSWTPGFNGNSPVIKYILQYRTVSQEGIIPKDDLNWITALTNISASNRHILLSHLRSSNAYVFRVSAVNSVGEGPSSLPSQRVILPQEPPSAPPQGLVGSARSESEIMIQWQPPTEESQNGEIIGYIVRYRLFGYRDSPWSIRNVTKSTQRTYLINELITWKDYEIQIAAYNFKGVGSYSQPLKVKTREGVPSAAPTDVRAQALDSSTIKVWWLPPDPQKINGINQGYKLQAWIGDPFDANIRAKGPEATVAVPPNLLNPLSEQNSKIDTLKAWTAYNITVLCFTSPGDGLRSPPELVRTHQDYPGSVNNLRFEDITDRGVKVLWDVPKSPNGLILGYTVRYMVKDMIHTMVETNLTEDTLNFKLNKLKPSTHYTFEVYALTEVGKGKVSKATIQSGVEPVLPSPPTRLAVSNIEPFSVVLQFTPGFDGNSSITQWTVQALNARNATWTTIYSTIDPDAKSIVVKNLTPYMEYQLRLLAHNVVGASEPSDPTKEFQTIQAPPSHAPQNVTIRATAGTELRVRWIPLSQGEWYGIPRGYNISYRIVDSTLRSNTQLHSISIEDPSKNSFVLNDLEEFTLYEVLLQAYNDLGSSEPSPVVLARTREAAPGAGPSGVSAEATSSTTILVRWHDVEKIHRNGIIEGFKVRYGAKGVPFKYKDIPSNITRQTTLTELKKFTQYAIQVLAYTRVGDGKLSSPAFQVKTFEDVPGPPSNVSFPDVSFTIARIIWDVPTEPNGEILKYRVTYRRRPEAHSRSFESTSPPRNFSIEKKNTDRTFRAVNLQPMTYYEFEVAAKTNLGWGYAASGLVYTTNSREAPQPPSAPQISLSQVQDREITFSWNPGNDGYAPLRYYVVQFSENNGPWISVPEQVDPALTSYTVKSLKPFTTYKFRIHAVNDIGPSGWSEESNFTKTLPSAPTAEVMNVKVTPITRTNVKVTWEPLKSEDYHGDASTGGYHVEYREITDYTSSLIAASAYPQVELKGISRNRVILEDLAIAKNYEIVVIPFNSQGLGPASRPVSVYVGEAVPTGAPQNVRAQSVSPTEVRLTWDAPQADQQNGDLLGYKIFYYSLPVNARNAEEIEVVSASHTNHNLIFLEMYTNYSISILAFNPAGEGPRSDPISVKTLQGIPGPPANLKFGEITMNTLKVSWDPPVKPNGEILGYIVAYETAEQDENYSKQVKQRVSERFLFIHNLEEEITYTFSVRAQTIDYGPPVIGNVTTGPQEGSPRPIRNLVLSKEKNAILLSWTNSNSGRGPILGYYIESRRKAEEEWQIYEDKWKTEARTEGGAIQEYMMPYQNLLPTTKYTFRVMAYSKYGISLPATSQESITTPSKRYLEYGYLSGVKPFYRQPWFLVALAAASIVITIVVVAILCVKSKSYKYKDQAKQQRLEEARSLDETNFSTFELRQSRRGTMKSNRTTTIDRNTVDRDPAGHRDRGDRGDRGDRDSRGTMRSTASRKSHTPNFAMINGARQPPRPTPSMVNYSDEDSAKGYDENPDDSDSLTEKPSEISSTDSQGTESEQDSRNSSDPHSFVNHYANVNSTFRQSWKKHGKAVAVPEPPRGASAASGGGAVGGAAGGASSVSQNGTLVRRPLSSGSMGAPIGANALTTHQLASTNPRGYSSFTESDQDGSSAVVSLNGTQIVMNNMARSRAPLPGFSSFV